MSTKISKRLDSKLQKSLHVTSKCMAIVLSPEESESGKLKPDLSGKVILDDFKLRNKTCYWNPALVESIRNLEYRGYVEPDTLLVGGEDVHLENLRTAWGRRVLNDPAHFRIIRIGDVGGIKMQVIPQTQFIPLPEILCLVILDLNSKQVVATLDVIHTRLTQCFCDLQSPGVQVLYDTLGTLIRERKVFHNGSGYFVVTPDTYRLPTDDPQQSYPVNWRHYNPMYIPVLANQSKALITRSISCQVSLANQPQTIPQAPPQQAPPPHAQPPHAPSTDVYKPSEEIYNGVETLIESVATEKPRLSRSSSARRLKDKSNEERGNTKPVSRCSSMKVDRCRGGENRDLNLANSNLNKVKDKGEKKSLLSKLFGRKKKKKQEEKKCEAPVTTTTSSAEYATFSAQFPPPEWQWYRDQVEKQERTQNWLSQQQGSAPDRRADHHGNSRDTTGSSSSDYICPQQLFPRYQPYEVPRRRPMKAQLSPCKEDDGDHYCQIDMRFEESLRNLRASTLPPEACYDRNVLDKNSECNYERPKNTVQPKADTLPEKQRTEENHHMYRRYSESHHRRPDISDRIRARRHSGDRKQLLVPANQLHGNSPKTEASIMPNVPSFPYHAKQKLSDHRVSEPMFSSTPLGLQRDPGETIHNNTIDELFNEKTQEHSHNHRKSSRHRHRHSFAYSHHNYPQNDISYEYHGKLPKKSSIKALSRDSGVNCIGLEQKGQGKSKSRDKNGRSMELLTKHSRSGSHNNVKQNNAAVQPSAKTHSNGNEVICVAEINNCVPPEARGAIPVEAFVPASVQEEDTGMDGDVDSFIDESEQSYDTVIDSRTYNSKRVDDLCEHVRNVNLVDSGFSSPRNIDCQGLSNPTYGRHSETQGCDEGSHHSSSSSGKRSKHRTAHPSKNRVKDPSMYERSDLIVLNNTKPVHRDQNVLSRNVRNQVPWCHSGNAPLAPETMRLDSKSPVPFQFNFDGDYQVVGVV